VSAAAGDGAAPGFTEGLSPAGSVTGLPTRLTGPGLQAAGQHTQAAGRGTAPAGRPDRLTIAAPPGDRVARRGRGRSGRRASTGGDGSRVHHTDRLPRAGSRRWRVRLIVLLVVLLVAGAAAFGGWWLGGRWTSAPEVLGVARDAAVAQVRDAGLVPSLTTAHDNVVPSGKVASADPTGGSRQLRGATVTLVISSGRPVVPRIGAGTTVPAATELIAAADLRAKTDAARDVYSDTVPAGAVVRTDPAGGRPADIGSTVVLIRSRGPVPVLVPTVAGKQVEDARNKLLVNGLAVGPPEQTFDPDQPAGTVLGTNPPAGSTVPHGSPVSLVVAASKTVPDVAGISIEQAARQLRDGGFDVTVGDPVFDATVPGGQVVRTDPPPGTRLDPADPAVTLIASTAVTVPPVTGMSVAMARNALEQLGLQVQVFAFFGADGSTVTDQRPDAGDLVEPGSTVQITAWP
jgi:serine/threonine-protein kinase